jgi:hypothetical protein
MRNRMMENTVGTVSGGLVLLFVVAACIGWGLNIYKLCSMGFDHVTGLMVARGIGIFVAPLGAVLGYF